MPSQNWRLSPSDFAFLWDDCKRCFYLKVARGFQRPRGIMPKIFTTIDNKMKQCFDGKPTSEFVAALPKGVVKYADQWVESKPIAFPGHHSECYLRGKFDTVIEFEEGGYAVIDLKTSEAKNEHVSLYGRQLHAYAYALENAAPGGLALRPIKKLGLLVFEPTSFSQQREIKATLSGELTWVEIPRNDRGFLRFLGEVMDVLEQPNPPSGADTCEWCRYRDASRRTKL